MGTLFPEELPVDTGKETPLMKQYYAVKAKHPDAILLFRVGDFYETFGEDAIRTADALGIILTHRNNGGSMVELAGFPYHSLEMYLPKLVKSGFRVAICEQLEKPSKEKKIIARGVTDMITPGVTTSDALLSTSSNNFLAAIHFSSSDRIGIALLDISTGEFLLSEGSPREISTWLQSFNPSEILFAKGNRNRLHAAGTDGLYQFGVDDWVFTEEYAIEKLLNHFQVVSLKGFGVEDLTTAQIAAGAILHYLQQTQQQGLKHIRNLQRIHSSNYMWMDRFTIRNLELVTPVQESGTSLLDIMDKTVSPMGSRLLKKWIVMPLLDIDQIRNRHGLVEHAIESSETSEKIRELIRQMGDLERMISKVALSRISPRELVQLKRSLQKLVPLKDYLLTSQHPGWEKIASELLLCEDLVIRLENSLQEDAPAMINKGNVIKPGYDETLDEYLDIITNSKEILIRLQQEEAAKTGIPNLKIGYNNVFGYYLEVTNKYKHHDLIPSTWIRKQTLSNGERYVTEELKKLEQKILTAEEKIGQLEEAIFNELVKFSQGFIEPIQRNAFQIAQLDVILSLANVAQEYAYTKPEINDSHSLSIKAGRHPVIERQLPPGEPYIANDLEMDTTTNQIFIITGPNMSGKSALLRQTALIVLMAQIGSYVPAEYASIGIVDKLFTRVGASDNISSGESTFMVEMNETASILNNISDRSLLLMDEIGRGTSTYDGISLAWSIAEYIHHHTSFRPKTLFATHYHELNALASEYDRIHNYHVATRETGQQVIFLRKLTPGGSEHSFGIHVARMAGMPKSLLTRASEILVELESKSIHKERVGSIDQPDAGKVSLNVFNPETEEALRLLHAIKDLDINIMSPLACLEWLSNQQKKLRE